jgi:hypothetical protein
VDPDPLKFVRLPPVAVTSPAANVIEGSLSVNLIVAVCPLRNVGVLDAIATVGATVSMTIAGESVPATLSLPAVSVNVAAAMETEPRTIELGVGVKIAV